MQLWRAPDFPPELHPHLRALMERFELMHPLRSMQASIDALFDAQTNPALAARLVAAARAPTTISSCRSCQRRGRRWSSELFPRPLRTSSRISSRVSSRSRFCRRACSRAS
jgi:hypothetical protein